MGLLGVIKSRSSFAVFPPLLPPGQMLFRNAWTAEFEPSYPPSWKLLCEEGASHHAAQLTFSLSRSLLTTSIISVTIWAWAIW